MPRSNLDVSMATLDCASLNPSNVWLVYVSASCGIRDEPAAGNVCDSIVRFPADSLSDAKQRGRSATLDRARSNVIFAWKLRSRALHCSSFSGAARTLFLLI